MRSVHGLSGGAWGPHGRALTRVQNPDRGRCQDVLSGEKKAGPGVHGMLMVLFLGKTCSDVTSLLASGLLVAAQEAAFDVSLLLPRVLGGPLPLCSLPSSASGLPLLATGRTDGAG